MRLQLIKSACAHAQSLSIVSDSCDPMNYSPPVSSVHGVFQAGILEWLPFPLPGDLPDPGIEPVSLVSPALAGGFFTTSTTWEAKTLICTLLTETS